MSVKPTAPELTEPALAGNLADPQALYRSLRDRGPLLWDEATGVWLASRHAEVWAISVDSQRFRSGGGILPLEIGIEYPSPPTMMHTDAPLHTAYRAILSPAFRPSRMRALAADLDALATQMVGRLPIGEPVDVVAALCVPYPLYVIAALLGVPSDDWQQFFEWSEASIPDAADLTVEQRQQAMADMQAYLLAVVHERRRRPQEDLISDLATAQLDGRPLRDEELLMFLDQLLVAGNETTRNLLSGSMVAIAEHPAEGQLLFPALDAGAEATLDAAVDEFLRWTTPVIGFMRTAAEPVELAGVLVEAGDPVHMLYASANRDERVFGADADRLRLLRSPNPHLAFGFGAHYCIGAALGRLEAKSIWKALGARFGSIELVSLDPSPSTIISGYRSAVLGFSAD